MTNFDGEVFRQTLAAGVEQHNSGRYTVALALSADAYVLAPEGSSEQAEAARNTAANFERLDELEPAEFWAERAYAAHSKVLKDLEEPTHEAYRERAASAVYVGSIGLHKLLQEDIPVQGQAPHVLTHFRTAWSDLEKARGLGPRGIKGVDQYKINASRRVSIAEGALGDSKRGLAIGVQAVGLALLSESPHISTSNPALSFKERMRAKTKALAGGLAAVGINVLYGVPGVRQTDQLATKFANKVL
jgi:hypothetical protein